MKDEEDEVGFDLSAWEAPPPPAGIAAAVIARVTAPAPAAAIEPEPPSRKRWWITGGAVTAVAAITAIAFGVRSSEVETGSGAVATAKPSHLELGGTALDLEANTDVWWVRDGKRIVAMQPRGTATWKVAVDDELVIDAGATVASVRASGASLRVEIEMNLSDARLIGTSAVTAAAVALVTVIVYEGHVRVTGADKTVEVPAGSTVEIAPNKPPVEPDRVAGLEKRLQSAVEEHERQIEFLKLENELLRKKFAAGAATVEPRSTAHTFDEVIASAAPKFKNCAKPRFSGTFTATVTVDDAGKASEIVWDGRAGTEHVCLVEAFDTLRFPKAGEFKATVVVPPVRVTARDPRPTPPARNGGDLQNPFIPAPASSSPKICGDAEEVEEIRAKGDQHMNSGSFAAALATYESIVKCKMKKPVISSAYLAACRARNFPKAKVYFNRLGKESFAQICMKEGYDPRK